MQKIKNEKGITLLSLVITIIVLIIIASISLNYGLDSIDTSKSRKLEAELELLHHAILEEYVKAKDLGYLENNEKIPENFAGTLIEEVTSLPNLSSIASTSDTWVYSENPEEKYKSYYKLEPEDLELLDINDSTDTYIVNYYTGEVFNQTKQKTVTGVLLYIKTRDIEDLQTLNETVDDTYSDW